MTRIAIGSETVTNWAQQLEARCDPAFIAQEIRAVLKGAKPAQDPAIVDKLVLEVRSFGRCRGKVHAPKDTLCDCRHCVVLREI